VRAVSSPALPVRLALSRRCGFRLQEASRAINGLACIVVARPTRWGNIFKVGVDRDAAQCVERFAGMLAGECASETERAWRARALKNRDQLKGKNLGCWCAPDAPSHADILLRFARDAPVETR